MNAHGRAITASLMATIWTVNLADASADTESLSSDAAEQQFKDCGYEVVPSGRVSNHPATLLPRFTPIEQPDSVSLFVVRDAGEAMREDGRSLTVIVFPTIEGAEHTFQEGARLTRITDQVGRFASQHGIATGPPFPPVDTNTGPPLFLGHGPSVWRRNVAINQLTTPPVTAVRETAAELEQRGLEVDAASEAEFSAAAQRAMEKTKPRSKELSRSPVDRDFVRCLDSR